MEPWYSQKYTFLIHFPRFVQDVPQPKPLALSKLGGWLHTFGASGFMLFFYGQLECTSREVHSPHAQDTNTNS